MEILLESEEGNAPRTAWVGGESGEVGERMRKGERIRAGKHTGSVTERRDGWSRHC